MALGKFLVTDWPDMRSWTLAGEKRGTHHIWLGRERSSVVARLSASQFSWAGRGKCR
jgi:hypothetical protein